MRETDHASELVLDRDIGARVVEDGTVFTVWAPRQKSVTVVLDNGVRSAAEGRKPASQRPIEHSMEAIGDGYFRVHVPGVRHGQRYWFKIAEGQRPDPASRFQPDGVAGPSMVIDPSLFPWTDSAFPGAHPAHEQVVYELHPGTFTKGGSWDSARERLTELAALGITTIEVMPIAEFFGRFGWGYDGVFLFAPYHHYGTPDDARRFIDAAHALGLAVILDVVYNHIGPVGSVLHEFSDHYLSEHDSEWGRGFNLDGAHNAPVRQFMRANVRLWMEEYHFDGLRFDAVHAIVDRSPEHLIDELTRSGREALPHKRVYMVAENEAQDVAVLRRDELERRGMDGLWNEDWHHSAFVALTGRREAYFTDYTGHSHEFAAMAQWKLLYQGQWYTWQKKRRGTDARPFARSAFVCFLENHDQVANTGFGARLYQQVDAGLWRAMTALLLLGPAAPMLFQGQERAVPAPFTYFADQEPPLADLVRDGRADFLSQFPCLRDPEARARLPVPSDEASFRRCQIDWNAGSSATWDLHVDLLRLRRADPVISRAGTSDVAVAASAPTPSVLIIRYDQAGDERLILVNFAESTTLRMNDPLLAAPSGRRWSTMWCSESVRYDGRGEADIFSSGAWRLQSRCAWLLYLVRSEESST